MTIIAPDNLPATMPAGASAFYARNISALLLGMVKDGALNLDFEDEVTKATVITHGRRGRQPSAVKKLLEPRRPGMTFEEIEGLLNALTIFTLAILVGFAVISKVPATLHTPADVGRQLDPRHRPRRRDAHRGRGRRPDRLAPGAHRRGVRDDERRRRLRRHRPDAPDVPQEARRRPSPRPTTRRPAS